MRRLWVGKSLTVTGAATFALLGAAWSANAGQSFSGKVNGYQVSPPIYTSGSGKCSATIKDQGQSVSYSLSYDGLSSDVTQAHIHFGQTAVNGGVIVFLCDNTGAAPSGTPACPNSGKVTGSVVASDVNPPNNPLPVNSQGIDPGDFAALTAALKSGDGYCNVHTTNYPAGEIRGQLKPAS